MLNNLTIFVATLTVESGNKEVLMKIYSNNTHLQNYVDIKINENGQMTIEAIANYNYRQNFLNFIDEIKKEAEKIENCKVLYSISIGGKRV